MHVNVEVGTVEAGHTSSWYNSYYVHALDIHTLTHGTLPWRAELVQSRFHWRTKPILYQFTHSH